MNASSLKNFIEENDVEVDWRGEMLLAWISSYDLMEFTEMFSYILDEDGIECNLQKGGKVCVDLVPILEYFGVDPFEIELDN